MVPTRLRRLLYLLQHAPMLSARKVRQRVARRWHYFVATRKAQRDNSPPVIRQDSNGLIGALTDALPLVVIERRTGFALYGVRAADVPLLLARCQRAPAQAQFLIDKRPIAAHPPARRVYSASRISLRVPAEEYEQVYEFEIFDPGETGSYVSRTGSNHIAGVLYCEAFAGGVTDLTSTMPELAGAANAVDIDIVYTWVNNRDAEWLRAFRAANPGAASADATGEARFYSNDELRYSLRSVFMHLPWAATIHIVSNCDPPDWLDTSHPRLRWVRHEQILPTDCLPTFNSHAIESALHRVPDLAETFLYFNDDFFVLRDMAPANFLGRNGTLKANLERQAVVNAAVDSSAPDYLNAARNSARLLFERYNYYPTRLHRHTPYALSRSLLQELEREFEEAIDRTRRARFRSITDINVPSFLAHHYGYVKRAVVYDGYPATLIKSNDPFSVLKMREADLHSEEFVVCINEGGTPGPTAAWRKEAATFVAKRFQKRAPWERGR